MAALVLILGMTAPASAERATGTAGSRGTAPTAALSCDFRNGDAFTAAAKRQVDASPGNHTRRCPAVAAYARASESKQAAADVPEACAAFAGLEQDRAQAALYGWAYRTIDLQLRDRERIERADRMTKALKAYEMQFAAYYDKISQYRDVCTRVHTDAATAEDLAVWSQSGRMMLRSVDAARTSVWDKDGVKSALDRSFASVLKALR